MKVTVNARRSGEWWALEVPEVPGVFTQVKRLNQAEDAVMDAVRTMQEDPQLEVIVEEIAVMEPAIQQVTQRVATHEAAVRQYREAVEEAVRVMLAQGLTVREVGTVLGLSPQRVSQVNKSTKSGTRAA